MTAPGYRDSDEPDFGAKTLAAKSRPPWTVMVLRVTQSQDDFGALRMLAASVRVAGRGVVEGAATEAVIAGNNEYSANIVWSDIPTSSR